MGLFVFLLFFVIFSVAGSLIYLLYCPIKSRLIKKGILSRKRNKQINLIYIAVIFISICISTYTGLYPDEDFYADEFKKVTLRDLPDSAEFISKSADYPDFHGDYCSSSAIRLSKADFKLLSLEMNKDPKMQKNKEIIGSATFYYTLRNSKNKEIYNSYTRRTPNEGYLFIGFCTDRQTIFINRCEL